MSSRLASRILHARPHPPFRLPQHRRFVFWFFDYWPKSRPNKDKDKLNIVDSPSPQPLPPPRRTRRHPALYLLAAIPVITLGLGFWQVYRLRWKLALIEEMDDKLARDALWLPLVINTSKLPAFSNRRILTSGHFLSSLTLYIGPKVHSSTIGYHALTPLSRALSGSGGTTILVNRGFVAREFCPGGEKYADSPIYREGEEGPEVQVEGLLREGGTKTTFSPANHPDQGEWYWPELPLIVSHLSSSAPNIQPVYVEEIFEGHGGDVSQRLADGTPIGRPARVELRNMHAVYALTWFSLSAATAAMFWALSTRRRVSGRGRNWRP